MSRTFRWATSSWTAMFAMVIALVFLANNCPHWATTAQGDVREAPRPEAFLSGGARSEIVLREIAETLKRIDSRLERCERALREPDSENTSRDAASLPRSETNVPGEESSQTPLANR